MTGSTQGHWGDEVTGQESASAQAPQERRSPAARIAMGAVIVLAVAGTAWLLIKLSGLLLLVFAALVLAAILDAMTGFICRIPGMRRGAALTVAVFAMLAVIIGAFTLFGTQIVGEFDTIRESIPPAIDQVQALLERAGLGETARGLIEQGQGDVSNLLSQAGGYAMTAGSGLANIVLLFVGAIFIASDPAVYRRGLILLMPHRAEGPLGEALDDAARGLRGWMMGQAVSSVVVGIFTWAGLSLLGVPAAGGLGIIAGLLDVIPMIGPIISGVPAVLLAFTVSPMTALWTTLLFLVIQQLQGNLLQPMIQKQAVDVPPAVLLFAVVAAGLLFGFMGVLLAAPLTVVVYVMVQRLYVRTLLGKKIKIAGQD